MNSPSERTRSPPGILVVHMQEGIRNLLTHESGDINSGIGAVCNVLKAGRNAGSPIYLATQKGIEGGDERVLREILEATAPLEERTNTPPRLIISGFNRIDCVFQAAKEAYHTGVPYVTSPDLLFGNRKWDDRTTVYQNMVLRYYQLTGKVYPNHQDLIDAEFRR